MPSGQLRPAARLAVVRNLRLLVELLADAVAHELAHHRKPVRLDPAACTACPMSDSRPPTFTCAIALLERFAASRAATVASPPAPRPTGTVTAESP